MLFCAIKAGRHGFSLRLTIMLTGRAWVQTLYACLQVRQHADAAVSGEEMVRYDSENVIVPRSVSPSRRRNASRCMSALDSSTCICHRRKLPCQPLTAAVSVQFQMCACNVGPEVSKRVLLCRIGSRFGSMHKAESWESIAGIDVRNPMPPVPPSPSSSATTPHSARQHRSSLDVGHLPHLSMLVCGGEPQTVSSEGERTGSIRRHEFAVETGLGPSIFHRTKVKSRFDGHMKMLDLPVMIRPGSSHSRLAQEANFGWTCTCHYFISSNI